MFTGKLESGPPKKAQATVLSLGGTCHDKVRIDSDFLVIGALGTDYWKTSRYGTKIEEVMHHRSASGATTRIVREVDTRWPPRFMAAVRDQRASAWTLLQPETTCYVCGATCSAYVRNSFLRRRGATRTWADKGRDS